MAGITGDSSNSDGCEYQQRGPAAADGDAHRRFPLDDGLWTRGDCRARARFAFSWTWGGAGRLRGPLCLVAIALPVYLRLL